MCISSSTLTRFSVYIVPSNEQGVPALIRGTQSILAFRVRGSYTECLVSSTALTSIRERPEGWAEVEQGTSITENEGL